MAMFTKVPSDDAGLPTTTPGTEVSKSCSTTMVTTLTANSREDAVHNTTIIAESRDDAVPQSDLVDSPNPSISQTGYHSAADCGVIASADICDVASSIALPRDNAPMATRVTIGTQCDGVRALSQSSYVDTSASSQLI